MIRKSRSLALVLALAVPIGGCISLLPKQKPVPLYRFGATPAPAATPASDRRTVAVRLAPVGFVATAAGDRILTVEGNHASYVGGGRWLGPAANLFESAVVQKFDASPGRVRLMARGEIAPVAYILKLDVRRFEARYESGPGGAPVVVVEMYAALDNPTISGSGRDRLFVARAQASGDRIDPIVVAFDQAVGQVLGDMVSWVNAAPA